jgi:hypothetical protein
VITAAEVINQHLGVWRVFDSAEQQFYFCAELIEALTDAGYALVDRKTLDELRDCYGDEFVDALERA